MKTTTNGKLIPMILWAIAVGPAAGQAADSDNGALTMKALTRDVSANLTYLADRQQIEDLEIAYATAHNTSNAELYRRIFTDDAKFVSASGAVMTDGMDNILKLVDSDRGRFNPDAKPGTETYGKMRHFITNLVVDVQGDTATATSYLLTTAYNPGTKKPEILSAAGRYDDVLIKRRGVWRIQQRAIIAGGEGNDDVARLLGVGPYTPKK